MFDTQNEPETEKTNSPFPNPNNTSNITDSKTSPLDKYLPSDLLERIETISPFQLNNLNNSKISDIDFKECEEDKSKNESDNEDGEMFLAGCEEILPESNNNKEINNVPISNPIKTNLVNNNNIYIPASNNLGNIPMVSSNGAQTSNVLLNDVNKKSNISYIPNINYDRNIINNKLPLQNNNNLFSNLNNINNINNLNEPSSFMNNINIHQMNMNYFNNPTSNAGNCYIINNTYNNTNTTNNINILLNNNNSSIPIDQSLNYANNNTVKKLKKDDYIIEMFGKKGWVCELCNNFNYETRHKCNRCGKQKMPKLISSINTNLNLNMNMNINSNISLNNNINNLNSMNQIKNKKFDDKKLNHKGDWICNKCNNVNYSFRTVCNRCQMPKIIN